MAIRSVATTDTLETFRTTFNGLGTEVGDVSTLTTTATNISGAINEIDSAVGTGIITLGSTDMALGATITTISGLTSLDSAALTVNSVNVATQPFAIAQAIALG